MKNENDNVQDQDNDVQNENNDETVIIEGILLKPDDDMKDVEVEPYEDETEDEDVATKNNPVGTPSGRIYRLVGTFTIIFGIIAFIFLLIGLSDFMDTPTYRYTSGSESFLSALVISFSISILFIVPGTICVGVGTIIDKL